MAGSIYNLTNYYSFLSSPIAKDQMNPVANLVYSSAVSKLYANSIGKNAQSSVSSYLSSLNSNVNKLKIDAKNLSSENSIKSSFNKKAVSSSDNGITGTAANNADKGSYTINVTQLAKAQTNTGIKLDSKADSAFTKGINSFSLKVGNTEKTVTFNVGTDDTNKTSLTSMANAINYTKAGVTASVATDSKTGLSYLNITSDKTGTGSAFTITDK
ncbi:MAG: flagellar cap protein FliD N-terminal domain-containing protein, partial [Bacillota bacterium]|nr:flagellar cap protein FliD N-terminal domain-containing protein [Bacillota bacterium]